jgi:hypothetical protein
MEEHDVVADAYNPKLECELLLSRSGKAAH